MKNKLISLFIMLSLVFGAFTAFAEETDITEISTLAELEAFRDDVNGGNTYEGKTVKLTADIDMSDKYGEGKENWITIDTFSGTFNGDNHTINGLYISRTEEDDTASLFRKIEGSVKNLNVKGYAKLTAFSGSANGIADLVDENASIIDCTFDGTLECPNYSAAGIASSNWGFISGCTVRGKIIAYHLVGGIASNNFGEISNCINEAEISGCGPVGGIVAAPPYDGIIRNCINKGSIIGKIPENSTVLGDEEPLFESMEIGGIVGAVEGNTIIENCYNIAPILGEDFVGGIIGSIPCWNFSDFLVNIKNCYNTGAISGKSYVGGIFGGVEIGDEDAQITVNANLQNCYNIGSVSGTEHIDGINAADEGYSETTNCYYLDTCISGAQADNILTLEQFADEENFTGWDFPIWEGSDAVWEMSKSLGRPVLRSNRERADITEISTLADLEVFRDDVNEGNTYEGKTVKLTSDIDMSDKYGEENGKIFSWIPIGLEENAFNGTFDGMGHSISGLYINQYYCEKYTGESRYFGLFGCANDKSLIKNLKTDGTVAIAGTIFGGIHPPAESKFIYGASIVGCTSGKIENCHNNSTFELGSNACYPAGICGLAKSGASIINCINTRMVRSAFTSITSYAIAKCEDSESITNCYYLEDTSNNDNEIEGVKEKDAEQFASGEVAYLLNGSTSEGNIAWYQNIGTDPYPVLYNTHSVVFFDGEKYCNDKPISDDKIKSYMSRMFFSDNNIQSEKVTSLNQLKELVYEQCDYDGIAEKYDEAFFNDKFLYLYRIDDGSSGNVYNITSAENLENSINIAVTQEIEGSTDDIVQWFLVVEIDKDLYNKDININFTDLQPIDCSIKYENEKAVVTAKQDGTYTVIFAAYDNGRLLSVNAQDIQLVKGENPPISPQNFDANGKVKVMLWDSLNSMKPLAQTKIQ